MRNYSILFASKEPIVSLPTVNNNNQSPTSCSDSGSGKVPCRKHSKHCSSCCQSERGNEVEKQHPSSSNFWKEKNSTRKETESKHHKPSTRKPNIHYYRAQDSRTDKDLLIDLHDKFKRQRGKNCLQPAMWTTASGKLWTTEQIASQINRHIIVVIAVEAFPSGLGVYKYRCNRKYLKHKTWPGFPFSCLQLNLRVLRMGHMKEPALSKLHSL